MKTIETKLAINKYWLPVTLVYDNNRIFFLAPFSKGLNSEIKLMEGHMYHGFEGAPLHDFVIKTFGKDKLWSVKDTQHNAFQLAFLQGLKPYARYKQDLLVFHQTRSELYGHQHNGVRFLLTRKQAILAGEMGVGKTLTDIEAREIAKPDDAWFVAPKSALKAVERELKKWNCTNIPELMTYQGLVKRVKSFEGQDIKPPQYITFDEASMIKNPTAQRSQAAMLIADAMREYWGDNCYIILMSGTPAPKSPLDWWMLCRIARPGFLIEGDYDKFKKRLAILVDRDFGGGIHKHIEAWKDRDNICDICGKTVSDPIHEFNVEMVEAGVEDDNHEFKLAINEVAKLHRRMSGLVLVQLKRDCLDLPEKRYEQIVLEPTRKIEQIARSLVKSAPSVAEALTRLRTLSDGFQYLEEKVGTEVCPICGGKKEGYDWVVKDEYAYNLPSESEESEEQWRLKYFDFKLIECIRCSGKGEVDVLNRKIKEVACPKEDALKELIEQHSDIGRLVVYGSFTGSVERCVRIFKDMEWDVIRWDGRGIVCTVDGVDVLDLFQDKLVDYPKVGFVGQPGAAGLGLTLTASPSCVYYSNTFSAVDRMQSEDRIHRIGIDKNRSPTIYDLFHLPTDRLVYNNIQEKIARQDLTLGISINMADVMESLDVR